MPSRRATAGAGHKAEKKATSKPTTPPVLRTSGEASTSESPIGPIVTSFDIPSAKGKPIKCEQYTPRPSPGSKPQDGAGQSQATASTPGLIFTHGAGGGLATPATSRFAIGAALTAPSLVFEGAFNLVARTKQFQAVLQHVLDSSPKDTEVSSIPSLGGRSLGARAAVQTANARNTGTSPSSSPFQTLVLVSYPLTGPSGDTRDAILCDIHPDVDVLFVSGDRDSMCDLAQLNSVRQCMCAHSWLAVVRGADHGMSVKPASAIEARQKATGALASRWLVSRDRSKTECVLIGTEVEEWTAASSEENGKNKDKRKAERKQEEVKKKKVRKTK